MISLNGLYIILSCVRIFIICHDACERGVVMMFCNIVDSVVFGTQANIYDGAFLWKCFTAYYFAMKAGS